MGIVRKELRDKPRTERLMQFFRETRGWRGEAERWLGEEVVAGWRLASLAVQQRVAAVRMLFLMWRTEDVQAARTTRMTGSEMCDVWGGSRGVQE